MTFTGRFSRIGAQKSFIYIFGFDHFVVRPHAMVEALRWIFGLIYFCSFHSIKFHHLHTTPLHTRISIFDCDMSHSNLSISNRNYNVNIVRNDVFDSNTIIYYLVSRPIPFIWSQSIAVSVWYVYLLSAVFILVIFARLLLYSFASKHRAVWAGGRGLYSWRAWSIKAMTERERETFSYQIYSSFSYFVLCAYVYVYGCIHSLTHIYIYYIISEMGNKLKKGRHNKCFCRQNR